MKGMSLNIAKIAGKSREKAGVMIRGNISCLCPKDNMDMIENNWASVVIIVALLCIRKMHQQSEDC